MMGDLRIGRFSGVRDFLRRAIGLVIAESLFIPMKKALMDLE